ncbi:sensor histidine kinase [Uliginosibacterium aquaticum]|uniref:histidine kinase n=1 Tax=Uliginosibacterium aquaticum TaxID=2731212 RepID=A0ABX2IID2_9RHOO|nr:ATP-binding protein [Uliginosibacterium aquaticum]NSL56047.1 HAMP domain-containing protein [Uliginosibacterium aquaticum]
MTNTPPPFQPSAEQAPPGATPGRAGWLERLFGLRMLIMLAVAFGLAVPGWLVALQEAKAIEKENMLQLQTDLQQLTEVGAESLREALWQIYPELGEPIVQAIFRDPRVKLMRVQDSRGSKPFFEHQRPLETGEAVISLKREVLYQGRPVGSLELSLSTLQASQRAEAAQRGILLRTALSLASSLLLAFIVLQWRLVRPIEYLKRASGRLARQALDEPIHLQRCDELGQLAQSMEATRVALARAFSELTASQQALREHADGLELRVAERTRELEESNLHLSEVINNLSRAQSELIEADRLASLGRMVAGIAHELNTPLGSSLTMVSTLLDHHRSLSQAVGQAALRRTQLDEFLATLGEGLHIAERNVNRAVEMVDKFRQVAVDQTSEQRRRFDLAVFMAELQLTLSPNFKRSPYTVHVAIPPGLIFDSYPGPLGQVISNLELNALVHGFDGRSSGNIWLSAALADDGMVRISLRDDGIGMSATVREHIFDPFFTTRLGRGGSGLGLAIVYNIVTGMLGGRISVNSQPEQGAEFVLELPLNAPTGSAPARNEALPALSQTSDC